MRIISVLKKINKKRNLAQRLFFLNAKVKLYKLWRRKEVNFTPASKIVLWVGKGLGDAVLASGFISSLRNSGYKVAVLTDKKNSFIFNSLITADDVIINDKKNTINSKYDILVDPYDGAHRVASKIRLLLKIKPKISIGFNSNLYDINIPYSEYNNHFTERYRRLLKLFNLCDEDSVKPVIQNNIEVEQQVDNWIKNTVNGKRIITFCPFASREIRSFSVRQCEIFLNELSSNSDYKIILLGSAEQLAQILESHSKTFITDPFCSLASAIAIIKYSDIVVSVDTLFVHISRIYNKKLYAVYNNRIIDGFYENNSVFSPGYEQATLFFTEEYAKTALGDDVSKFDIGKITAAIKLECNNMEV